MVNIDNENASLIKELEKKEAGVKELFEFYAGVETVYAASIKALEQNDTLLLTDTTNDKVK
jgi:hypothetical protein